MTTVQSDGEDTQLKVNFDRCWAPRGLTQAFSEVKGKQSAGRTRHRPTDTRAVLLNEDDDSLTLELFSEVRNFVKAT
jgi:hypothetical protein